jgi:hypothetical protein
LNSTTRAPRTTAWFGKFSGVPNNLQDLRVTYQGKNSQTCAQTIAMFNWATDTWTQLDARNVGTTEVNIGDLVPPGTLADYVSGTSGDGQVRLRVRCQKPSAKFIARGDLLRIDYVIPASP